MTLHGPKDHRIHEPDEDPGEEEQEPRDSKPEAGTEGTQEAGYGQVLRPRDAVQGTRGVFTSGVPKGY